MAYKQPVTKNEIESIRGIRCDRVIEGLMSKDLVEQRGRSDGIGRPMLYGTTETFLRYFDLESIKELPDFDQAVQEVEAADQEEDILTLNQISLEEMNNHAD